MNYKYEIHSHTKETSRCGKIRGAELVQKYIDAGYSGIVITDHYSPMTFDPKDFFNKKSAIDHYLRGYRAAKAHETEDFSVLLGVELRFYCTVNDYLIYGVSEEMLYELPFLLPLQLKAASKLLRQNGCAVIQAHPFRKFITRANTKHLDGVEILNGKTPKALNDMAKNWADSFAPNIQVGGSDVHSDVSLASSGIITQEPIKTNADLMRILRSGEFEIIKPQEDKM